MNLSSSPIGYVIALVIEFSPLIFGAVIAFIMTFAVKIFPTRWVRYWIGSLLTIFFTCAVGVAFMSIFPNIGELFIIGPFLFSLPVSLILFILILRNREKKTL